MHKKIFILTLIISLVCFSSICFANNTMAEDVKDMGKDAMNTVDDGINNIGSSITNTTENAGNEIGQSENKIENDMDNMTQDKKDDDNKDNTMAGITTNGDYTTTQTAVTSTMENTNFWTWAIIILAAIGIIAVIWYYSSQNKEDHNRY